MVKNSNNLWLVVIIAIVVALAVSLITANITGMITSVYSTSETYTKSEMDIKLKNVSATDCLRYNNCDVHNLNLIHCDLKPVSIQFVLS